MKKAIFVILLIFFAIIISIYMNYKQTIIAKTQVKKVNSEFEFYQNKKILGTDITTVINKATDNNEKYDIKKDGNDNYIPDEENSIKIYINMIINETTYPMEALQKRGLDDFTRYFGEVEFECTDIKYHEQNRKIAEMTFSSIEY